MAGLSDFSGEQVQIDESEVLGHPDDALVEAHCPHRHESLGLGNPALGGGDVLGFDATDRSRLIERTCEGALAKLGETFGVCLDKIAIECIHLDERASDGVAKRDV